MPMDASEANALAGKPAQVSRQAPAGQKGTAAAREPAPADAFGRPARQGVPVPLSAIAPGSTFAPA